MSNPARRPSLWWPSSKAGHTALVILLVASFVAGLGFDPILAFIDPLGFYIVFLVFRFGWLYQRIKQRQASRPSERTPTPQDDSDRLLEKQRDWNSERSELLLKVSALENKLAVLEQRLARLEPAAPVKPPPTGKR